MLKNVIIFAAGVVLGSVITYGAVKKKYERIADEEIKSVKDTFRKKKEEKSDECFPTTEELEELKKMIATNAYTSYSSSAKKEESEEDDMRPFTISPDEFDEIGYKTESLTFWADGVVTDEADFPIDDIDDTIGEDSLSHFGEYEDDSVFVRNDRLRTDYEILMDSRKFSEVYPDRNVEG